MYCEPNGQHHTPHIHAKYSGKSAVISLDGDVLEDGIPAKQLRMVLIWIDIHKEELLADWELISNGQEYFRIDPLR